MNEVYVSLRKEVYIIYERMLPFWAWKVAMYFTHVALFSVAPWPEIGDWRKGLALCLLSITPFLPWLFSCGVLALWRFTIFCRGCLSTVLQYLPFPTCFRNIYIQYLGHGEGVTMEWNASNFQWAQTLEFPTLFRACMHSFFIDCQSARELRITSISRDAAS